MLTSEFDYDLPPELIAQTPLEPRDSSRLMVLDRTEGTITHRHFHEIGDYLNAGDILVANNSRVIPARLFGRKTTGGRSELLLLEKQNDTAWTALVKGKKNRVGTVVDILTHEGEPSGLQFTILAELSGAKRMIAFSEAVEPHFSLLGHTPLPPYIGEAVADAERYQTVYSQPEGSAAAPTAGLHFTPDLLFSLREKRVQFETATLHVGLDTFQPVKSESIEGHEIHSERVVLDANSAERINKAKLAGGRIVAIGTTSTRVLETAALRASGVKGSLSNIVPRQSEIEACPWKPVVAIDESSDLYIYPGYHYRAVDTLITNFHLPRSSLLMLVEAFTGREMMREAYARAIEQKYRFFSFGDAMIIL